MNTLVDAAAATDSEAVGRIRGHPPPELLFLSLKSLKMDSRSNLTLP